MPQPFLYDVASVIASGLFLDSAALASNNRSLRNPDPKHFLCIVYVNFMDCPSAHLVLKSVRYHAFGTLQFCISVNAVVGCCCWMFISVHSLRNMITDIKEENCLTEQPALQLTFECKDILSSNVHQNPENHISIQKNGKGENQSIQVSLGESRSGSGNTSIDGAVIKYM